MRRSVSICLFIIIIALSQNISAEKADAPTWRPRNVWQYNMTIDGNPNHQTATIYVTGAGSVYDDDNVEHKIYDVNYITNVLENSDDYGHIYTRSIDNRKITRWPNYETSFSIVSTYVYFDYGRENKTIRRTVKYQTFIDFYDFPLQVGDAWSFSSVVNTSTAIYKGASASTPSEEDKIKEFYVLETERYFFNCTGTEDVNVVLADDPEYYWANSTANWTAKTLTAIKIIQDDERNDSDGTYIVEYYNASIGNIVKRESYINGDLNSSRILVYYVYVPHEDPYIMEDWTKNDSGSELTLCVAAIAIVIILLLALVIIRRRHLEEDKFTRENIESIETKTELIELCEEAGLSPKGSKSQLRKRLMAYVDEKEKEEAEDEEDDEESEDEDEFDIGEEKKESEEESGDDEEIEDDELEEEDEGEEDKPEEEDIGEEEQENVEDEEFDITIKKK
jgi:hypothetical protein